MPVRSSFLVVLAAPVALIGVSLPAFAGGAYKAPRTLDGQPDFQGNWTNVTLTTFERPKDYGNRGALTPDEAAKIEGFAAHHVAENAKPTDPKTRTEDLPTDCGYGFKGANCGYNNFWVDRGTQVMRVNGEPRSSLITQPENGQMPPMKPEAMKARAERMAARRGMGPADGPELRPLGERCLLSFGSSAGPPMLPSMYNNTYSIAQSKDTVMIVVEMVHDVRVVRLGGTHPPASVRKWMGDSIGHFEGDSLVVETTNFRDGQEFRGAGENRKVTERFTRVSPHEILYQFKVEDPTTLTQPVAGDVMMNRTPDKMYEYACHEGNYALPGILAGAREDERVAAGKGAAVKQKSKAELDKEAEGE